MTYLLAGLLLGLAGSIHCASMCGPILLAVNRQYSHRYLYGRMLVYHAARVIVYAAIGVAAGYTGQTALTAGFGRAVAVASGVLLICGAIGVTPGRWLRPLTAMWSSLTVRMGTAAASITRRSPLVGYAALGAANGLLPCGLVYAALATSLALGNVGRSVAFMAGFGLGTVPVLVALTLSAASIPASWRRRLRFAGPALLVVAGVLLIARGVLPIESGHHHETAILFHQH